MESILITPKNGDDLQLILSFIKQYGMKSRLLLLEEKEDIGLAILMQEVNRTEYADRSEIMMKLG